MWSRRRSTSLRVRQALSKAHSSASSRAEADKLQSARWEILSEGYKMSNYAPLPQMQRTSMYSSMTQQDYAAFFYDMAGNAIPARNRVKRWYPAKIALQRPDGRAVRDG